MDSSGNTLLAPNGSPVYCGSGVLEPGYKAAIEILRHEVKVVDDELVTMVGLWDPTGEVAEALQRRRQACTEVIALLAEYAERMNLVV